MSAAITAAGVAVVGGAIVANDQAQRAKGQANKMQSAAKKGIAVEEQQLEEQKYQFDAQMAEYQRKQALLEQQFANTQAQLAPYIQSGTGALFEMNALLGLAAPQQTTYQMQKSPTTGQYQVTQQPAVQRPSPALQVGGAAPTTPAAGRMGILSQTVAPITRAGEMPQAASQRAADVAAELSKGGRSLSSKAWQTATKMPSGEFGTRATAAKLFQEVQGMMPEATAQEVMEETQRRALTLPETGAAAGQMAGQGMQPAGPVSPYAGMTGQEAQAAAIERIAQSPLLAELTRQGEEAMLQQRAATGGLRGGNVQAALAQFRPQMLQAEIDKYYNRLAGMSGVGQQSILSAPTMGQAAGYPTQYPTSNLGQLYAGMGAIQPEGQGAVNQALIGGIGQLAGAGLGYLANRPQTPQATTNLTASGNLMPNVSTTGNFWSRPPG